MQQSGLCNVDETTSWKHFARYRSYTLTASRGHNPTSAINSADAEAARKRGVWNLAAVSAPARSAYVLHNASCQANANNIMSSHHPVSGFEGNLLFEVLVEAIFARSLNTVSKECRQPPTKQVAYTSLC